MCVIRFGVFVTVSMSYSVSMFVAVSDCMCMNVFVSGIVRWGQGINLLILFCSHSTASLNLSHSLSLTVCLFYFLCFPPFFPLKLTIYLLLFSLVHVPFFCLHISHRWALSLSFSHRHNREILTKYDLSTSACYQCANKAIHILPTPSEFIVEKHFKCPGYDTFHRPTDSNTLMDDILYHTS